MTLAVASMAVVGCAIGTVEDGSERGERNTTRSEIFPMEDAGAAEAPCHPGSPDCNDTGTPPPPPPPPKDACVETTETCSMGPCNASDGSDEAACKALGNPGGCPKDVYDAWCTRRVGDGKTWDGIHEKWVIDHCGGTATLEENTFIARNEAACKTCKCTTPLVLVFDSDAHVAYSAYSSHDGSRAFDLSASQDGSATHTDWPTSATPWLAIDRDGDGAISSGRELFGSATRLANGTIAEGGFAALVELDENGDGRIDASDSSFSKLTLWFDVDGDRRSTPSELRSLDDLRIVSIDVHPYENPRCDARGNCEVERASFRFRDASGTLHVGSIVDIHLAVR